MLLDHVLPDHWSPGSHDVRSHVARSHVTRSHVARSHMSYHMSPDHMSDRMMWCEFTSVTQQLFEPITSTLTSPCLSSPHRVLSRSCSCPDLAAIRDPRPVDRVAHCLPPARPLIVSQATCPPAVWVARQLPARHLPKCGLCRSRHAAHPCGAGLDIWKVLARRFGIVTCLFFGLLILAYSLSRL